MSDYNKPIKEDQYEGILTTIRDLFTATIRFLDSRDTDPANKPVRAKRWDDATARFQSWEGAAWVTKLIGLAGGGTGAQNAAGARTNLEVDSSTEVTGKVTTHNNVTAPHSAASAATASRLALRDTNGRCKFAEGAATGDALVFSQLASGATASKIMVRDAAGRAKVAAPSAADDIARLDTITNISTSFAPGSDFTHGTFYAARTGNIISLRWSGLSHASKSIPSSAAGVIPANYRPVAQVHNLFYNASGIYTRILVFASGTISFYYMAADGTAVAQTAPAAGCISYPVN